MKNILLIISLFSLINKSYSQEKSNENGWSVLAKVGVLNSNYTFKPLSTIQQLLGYELENRLNQNYDLELGYQLEKVALKIGASYIGRGYRQNYNWVTPGGNSFEDPSLPSYTNMKANYINWSLSFGYSFVQKPKFSITPVANFIYGGLVYFKEETVYGNDKTNTKETEYVNHQFSSTVLATSFSVDFKYAISTKISVLLSPYLMYTFSQVDNNLIQQSNHSFGGNLGIAYHL